MFQITARSVLELGSELISSDIIAFYELIKNGFDASTDSTKRKSVSIHFDVVLRKNLYLRLIDYFHRGTFSLEALKKELYESLITTSPNFESAQALIDGLMALDDFLKVSSQIYNLNSITVSDEGCGMSLDDLKNNFLVIGTASRKHAVDNAILSNATSTPYLGEKGIGRLSAMRLGEYLEVRTSRQDDDKINTLKIDWQQFANLNAMLSDIAIEPVEDGAKPFAEYSGTKIIIKNLSEDWTKERVERMVSYDISKLIDPFLDPAFRPSIATFWNGERFLPPWMSSELLDAAHAKVSGEFKIIDNKPQFSVKVEVMDLGFAHPYEVDYSEVHLIDLLSMIGGTEQHIPESALFSLGPFKFEAYWYNRRRLTALESVGNRDAVKRMQEKWSGIMLYRDGFRVFPYGEDEDDWLALDRKALRRSGYLLNKDQFVGKVEISRIKNPYLLDQTNREGLRETPEQMVFLTLMKYVIQEKLFNFIGAMERQYKDQKPKVPTQTEAKELESRAKTAISKLRKHVPQEFKGTVEELEQIFYNFSNVNAQAFTHIGQVENESRQMLEMAGVGLMIEVVAHELARVSENALENLDEMRKKANLSDDVRKTISSLQSQMKSLSKRIKILDPMSVSGRQRFEVFSLDELLAEISESHSGQFSRHNIKLIIEHYSHPVRVKAVKGMIIQIIENLISNSKYWMEMRKLTDKGLQSTIRISLFDSPPTLIYQDNGYGIAEENKDKVFTLFFSLKEKSKRRGLGLFIAKECAKYNDGNLILDNEISVDTGRLHKFILELPQLS